MFSWHAMPNGGSLQFNLVDEAKHKIVMNQEKKRWNEIFF